MLIDIATALAILAGAVAIFGLGLPHGVGLMGLALLVYCFALSEGLARRARFKITGWVLTLVATAGCAVLGHLAILSIGASDAAPDIARQFFAPLTAGAACAAIGALAHYLTYRAPFTWLIGLAAGLYAVFGALKLGFGNGWMRL
jgi:4-amino-4-deoxy-L-arabinose transferase-like glycosyltransferase